MVLHVQFHVKNLAQKFMIQRYKIILQMNYHQKFITGNVGHAEVVIDREKRQKCRLQMPTN